jgi:hypothetical protein
VLREHGLCRSQQLLAVAAGVRAQRRGSSARRLSFGRASYLHLQTEDSSVF